MRRAFDHCTGPNIPSWLIVLATFMVFPWTLIFLPFVLIVWIAKVASGKDW